MELSILVFSVLMSLGVTSLAITIFSSSVFSSTLENNTTLEQAQKSLEENQKQPVNVSPEPSSNGAVTDNIQNTSKITKLTSSTSKYENNDYGISIGFPSNWKPSEVSLPKHGIVNFNASTETSLEEYVDTPASVLVASYDLPVLNMTLPEFIKYFMKDRYVNPTDYRIINSSKSNLAGLESEKIMMFEYEPGTLKLLRNIAIDYKTNIAYMIKYAADPGMFSRYLPIVEQMMNSFALTK